MVGSGTAEPVKTIEPAFASTANVPICVQAVVFSVLPDVAVDSYTAKSIASELSIPIGLPVLPATAVEPAPPVWLGLTAIFQLHALPKAVTPEAEGLTPNKIPLMEVWEVLNWVGVGVPEGSDPDGVPPA